MIKYAIHNEMEVAVATECNILCKMMHELYGDTNFQKSLNLSQDFGAGLHDYNFLNISRLWDDILDKKFCLQPRILINNQVCISRKYCIFSFCATRWNG